MKFCIKCGQKIEADSEFCPFCGTKQPPLPEKPSSQADMPASATGETEPVTSATQPQQSVPVADVPPVNQSTSQSAPTAPASHSSLSIIIGVIVLVIVVGLGKYGYDTYQRNHLSEQAIADISQTVVTEHLGSSNEVYYSKRTNTIRVIPDYDSKLYQAVEDVITYNDGNGIISTYLEKFKKISEEMADKMPTKDHDVKVQLVNPENEDRYLYIVENGTVVYDFND
ncbi:hypothetical protein C5Z26_04405 [Lactobacillus sp. CBA3606]|uniref:zinc ribbon domain-containing protein n=1 Tax=Lactobacillus sp. CBA3606 TaxID=2099789 RepID=UPI000CFE2E62|nr:zinc ribbon domain-containing protein [Lactobacillus sp. CBA3606]AVK63389.1 hypothetical protein C5Z26_04405 [Lactobacillus sp. CBA3606]